MVTKFLSTSLFLYQTKSSQSRRLSSIGFVNRTHRKAPFRLCSIAEPIELQSNDWIRLGSIGFWFGFVRLTTPGTKHSFQDISRCFQNFEILFSSDKTLILSLTKGQKNEFSKILTKFFGTNRPFATVGHVTCFLRTY